MTNVLDIFFGTPQSKFTAYAIFAVIIALSISILFSSTDVSVGERFWIIFLIILLSIPSILLTLFELTCIITGGSRKVNWWCWYFGWLIAAFFGIYSVIVIIAIFISMISYNNAMTKVNNTSKAVSQQDANDFAKNVIAHEQPVQQPAQQPPKENFAGAGDGSMGLSAISTGVGKKIISRFTNDIRGKKDEPRRLDHEHPQEYDEYHVDSQDTHHKYYKNDDNKNEPSELLRDDFANRNGRKPNPITGEPTPAESFDNYSLI